MSRYLYKKIQNISPESLNFQHSGLKLTTLVSDPNIHSDEIVKELGDWRNTSDVLKAGKIAVQLIDKYFSEGISFNQESMWEIYYGEEQNEKGLMDLLYGVFSGNQKKVLSYIPDSNSQIRQKEVSDMLSMISYAEERGEKKV